MKNIVNSLSRVSKLLCIATVLFAGAVCNTADAAFTLKKSTYYFDNTLTQWSKVYLRYGQKGQKDGGSGNVVVLEMQKMAGNANLYYYNVANDYNDCDAVCFASYSDADAYYGIYTYHDGKTKSAYIQDGVAEFQLFLPNGSWGDKDFIGLDKGSMPSILTFSSITVNSTTYTEGKIMGSYTAGSTVTVVGKISTNISNRVSATMHYCSNYVSSSSTFAVANMPGGTSFGTTKTGTGTFKAPSAAGKYKLAVYFKCGDIYLSNNSSNYNCYYYVPGLTMSAVNFGSVKQNETKTVTASITGIYTDDKAKSIVATIPDGVPFTFSDGSRSKTINVAANTTSASVSLKFAPVASIKYSTKLTLTLKNSTEVAVYTKSVDLSGIGLSNAKPMVGAPAEVNDGKTATLYGYLQTTACDDIRTRGFIYSTTKSYIDKEVPTTGTFVTVSPDKSSAMEIGETWNATTVALTKNTTYYYKAYVEKNGNKTYSENYSSFTIPDDDACAYTSVGDTVFITVDNSITGANLDSTCTLKFKTLNGAIKTIKERPMFSSGSSNYNLVRPVVISVVPNRAPYDKGANVIEDINKTNTDKALIICSADKKSRPTIDGLRIVKSKAVVLDNLRLTGAAGGDALAINSGRTDYENIPSGEIGTAKVVIENCRVESVGFTGVQIIGYDGITFENNEIVLNLSSSDKTSANTNYWGSSIKVIQCKNLKFLRNNFRGSHATSLWLQGLSGGLIMNNVFWNNNDSYSSTYPNNVCFIRLITQFPESGSSGQQTNTNEKLDIYYNTFYLAKNDNITNTRNVDFFRLGSNYSIKSEDGKKTITLNYNLANNKPGTIRFMYNNCYSYDSQYVSGANKTTSGGNKWCLGDTESNWCQAINKNNFWSMKDEELKGEVSIFNIPNASCDPANYFVNVYEQVCSTTNDPSDLIVKGGDMNFGSAIKSTEQKSDLGAENIFNDRLYAGNGADAIRKVNGKWTLGAYQQTDGSDFPSVQKIIWTGAADSNWDNRGNWVTPKADGTGYKKLTCVDNIDPDVEAIIPAPNSDSYAEILPDGGIQNYPMFPNKFEGTRTAKHQETVNAGHGVLPETTKFVKSINLEYGGAIKGVEALKDDNGRRYTEANTSFTAGRSEWILVGTVVSPFSNGAKSKVRLVQSGDYFIADHLPHVYMHEAVLNDDAADWQRAFADLDVSVPYDRVFAIKIPNEYGPKKMASQMYYQYRDPSKVNDYEVPKTFDFNGWFLNDSITPEYKITGSIILCNTYPATLDVAATEEENHGSVKYYDYDAQNFETYASGDKDIKPQGGFIFKPYTEPTIEHPIINDGWFRITPAMITNRDTKYKGAEVVNPLLKLRASNPAGTDGSSSALIVYDELKANEYVQGLDLINTTIAGMPTKPEVYVMMYGKELDKVTVPTLENAIPLGLKLEQAMTVEFSLPEIEGIDMAIIEDREAGKSYDLLKGEKGSISLAAGTYAGRFFLNLGAEEQGMPTEDDPIEEQGSAISIYAGEDGVIVISSSLDENLVEAQITNMGGNTQTIKLKDSHYNSITLDGAQGTYVVKAIGETQSKTAKVIVK